MNLILNDGQGISRVRFALRSAIFGLVLGCGIVGCQEAPQAVVPPPPTVGVIQAEQKTVPIELVQNGTTRALEEVAVRARVRGFLTEKHFDEGTYVKKDQLLFVIDEAPYKVALQQALAKQDEARAALSKAEQSKVREVAAAQVALDEAQLNLSLVEENRARSLNARNAGSREEVDRAEATRKKFEAQVNADRATLEQAKADYDVGILTAKAQVEAAVAAVRDAEINLSYCRMTAAIDGRIGEAKVKIGNLVGPEMGATYFELATIQQLDPMSVDIRPSARYLDRSTNLIAKGLEVQLTSSGLDGDLLHPYPGQAYFIDNTIDPTTSTFLMKAKVPNPQMSLLPGAYVNIAFTVDVIENAVVVPETAVMETEAGPVVYVVDSKSDVVVQRVEAGPTVDGFRVIMKGLDVGASVIVEGIQLVRPGIAVKAEPAILPRRASKSSPGDKVAQAEQKSPSPGVSPASDETAVPQKADESDPKTDATKP